MYFIYVYTMIFYIVQWYSQYDMYTKFSMFFATFQYSFNKTYAVLLKNLHNYIQSLYHMMYLIDDEDDDQLDSDESDLEEDEIADEEMGILFSQY